MKKITISVDDETHRIAEAKAAEKGTSVSALVREFLCSLSQQGFDANEPTLAGPVNSEKTLSEIVEDVRARGGRIRSADNIPRDELYNRNALR